MRILVIIPAHNEAQNIAAVVVGVKARGLDALVVDDGSSDSTGALAREHGAQVLTHTVKQGKGQSLREGFQFAVWNQYDGVITMDGDGQHAVADLDGFLEKISEKPTSIICGSRMAYPKGMPFIRRVTNRIMSDWISRICRQTIPDTQCGYRYISCTILRNIQIAAKDFEIETEVLVEASKQGYPIFSVTVQTIYGNEKSKINPFKDTLRFFGYILREMRRPRA